MAPDEWEDGRWLAGGRVDLFAERSAGQGMGKRPFDQLFCVIVSVCLQVVLGNPERGNEPGIAPVRRIAGKVTVILVAR